MNKTEKKAAEWLERQGIIARYSARANPDFIAKDGTGYEVKLARGKDGGQIFFTHHQYNELDAFADPLYVLVFESDSRKPIQFHFDDVRARNIDPYWVYIEEPKSSIAIDPELHHQLKIEAAKTNHSIRELVEAALRLYLDRKDQEG